MITSNHLPFNCALLVYSSTPKFIIPVDPGASLELIGLVLIFIGPKSFLGFWFFLLRPPALLLDHAIGILFDKLEPMVDFLKQIIPHEGL